MNEPQNKTIVDARQSWCSALETVRAIMHAEVNGVIEVVSTDPQSVKDINEIVTHSHYELLSSSEDSGEYFFSIKKTH